MWQDMKQWENGTDQNLFGLGIPTLECNPPNSSSSMKYLKEMIKVLMKQLIFSGIITSFTSIQSGKFSGNFLDNVLKHILGWTD